MLQAPDLPPPAQTTQHCERPDAQADGEQEAELGVPQPPGAEGGDSHETNGASQARRRLPRRAAHNKEADGQEDEHPQPHPPQARTNRLMADAAPQPLPYPRRQRRLMGRVEAAGVGPGPQRPQVQPLGDGAVDESRQLRAEDGGPQERGCGAEDHRRRSAPGEGVATDPGPGADVEDHGGGEQDADVEGMLTVTGHGARRIQQVGQGGPGPDHVPDCTFPRPPRPRGAGAGDVRGGLGQEGHLGVQERDIDESGAVGASPRTGEAGAYRAGTAGARHYRLIFRQHHGVVGEPLGEIPGVGFQARQPDEGADAPEPH